MPFQKGNKLAPKPFVKGQSGNPSGKPRHLPKLDVLLADVLGEEKDGMTAAAAILKALRLKATKGDVRACEALLDRAYGKAKQPIQHDISTPFQLTFNPAPKCEPLNPTTQPAVEGT